MLNLKILILKVRLYSLIYLFIHLFNGKIILLGKNESLFSKKKTTAPKANPFAKDKLKRTSDDLELGKNKNNSFYFHK